MRGTRRQVLRLIPALGATYAGAVPFGIQRAGATVPAGPPPGLPLDIDFRTARIGRIAGRKVVLDGDGHILLKPFDGGVPTGQTLVRVDPERGLVLRGFIDHRGLGGRTDAKAGSHYQAIQPLPNPMWVVPPNTTLSWWARCHDLPTWAAFALWTFSTDWLSPSTDRARTTGEPGYALELDFEVGGGRASRIGGGTFGAHRLNIGARSWGLNAAGTVWTPQDPPWTVDGRKRDARFVLPKDREIHYELRRSHVAGDDDATGVDFLVNGRLMFRVRTRDMADAPFSVGDSPSPLSPRAIFRRTAGQDQVVRITAGGYEDFFLSDPPTEPAPPRDILSVRRLRVAAL
ncbi:hypothetical protein F1188_05420 [Roseospira marina]|uniref:DUF2961 domain-containing protein n=1 Tax=Roseospira marina TaxID=140057 RepID=A0A5M6IG78_9PROT|nr:hypothetical protein [Roseospira marina]KAA5606769.1 hypothetical protein F1188_05420 [Roseospira marina]MBB4313809.1 hypothetical protein [Roseospira marina]MBB5086971.1 hypothetical protein [Roseospira marina]